MSALSECRRLRVGGPERTSLLGKSYEVLRQKEVNSGCFAQERTKDGLAVTVHTSDLIEANTREVITETVITETLLCQDTGHRLGGVGRCGTGARSGNGEQGEEGARKVWVLWGHWDP